MPAPRSAAAPSCGDRRLITRQAEWLLGAAELAADQPRIEPVAGQQFAMGAGLDEPAAAPAGERAIRHRQLQYACHQNDPTLVPESTAN